MLYKYPVGEIGALSLVVDFMSITNHTDFVTAGKCEEQREDQ